MKKINLTITATAVVILFTGCSFMSDIADEMNMGGSPASTFSPADGAKDIYPHSDISIKFSEPMNSSGWAVIINGTQYTEGRWSGSTLIVDPADFAWGETVNVELKDFFAASDGSAYTGSRSFSFTVRGTLPVADMVPGDGTAGHSVTTNLVFTFSEPMDTAGEWSLTAAGVTYNKNSMAGEAVWSPSGAGDNTVLTINPSGVFTRGAIVDVSLNGFTAALDGGQLQEPRSFWFRATTLEEVRASISPGNTSDIPVDANIGVTFSEPMNKTNCTVRVTETINGTPYITNYTYQSPGWSWPDGSNVLTINPAGTFVRPEPGKTTSVKTELIGFTAVNDGAALIGDLESTFSVRGLPVVNVFSPVNNATGISGSTVIRITFSEPMNAAGWWTKVGPVDKPPTVYGDWSPPDQVQWNAEGTGASG